MECRWASSRTGKYPTCAYKVCRTYHGSARLLERTSPVMVRLLINLLFHTSGDAGPPLLPAKAELFPQPFGRPSTTSLDKAALIDGELLNRLIRPALLCNTQPGSEGATASASCAACWSLRVLHACSPDGVLGVAAVGAKRYSHMQGGFEPAGRLWCSQSGLGMCQPGCQHDIIDFSRLPGQGGLIGGNCGQVEFFHREAQGSFSEGNCCSSCSAGRNSRALKRHRVVACVHCGGW